jgi:predicted nucleic acid-binding protein
MLENAFALSLDFNQGFFDCVYIETARRDSTQLPNVDEKLIKKFSGSNVDIIHLNDGTP